VYPVLHAAESHRLPAFWRRRGKLGDRFAVTGDDHLLPLFDSTDQLGQAIFASATETSTGFILAIYYGYN
jgi:hypothetical protein